MIFLSCDENSREHIFQIESFSWLDSCSFESFNGLELRLFLRLILETQIESTRLKGQDLEEQIRVQPMSTSEAQELHQSIRDAENLLRTKRTQQDQSLQRISELQMQHNK